MADDAANRRDLRDAGQIVFLIMSADLGDSPPIPGWYAEEALSMLVHQRLTIVRIAPNLREGPWRSCVAGLPNRTPTPNVMLLARCRYSSWQASNRCLSARRPTVQLAEQVLGGAQLPAGNSLAFSWRRGPLAIAVRITDPRVEIAVLLDDDAAAVDSPIITKRGSPRSGWCTQNRPVSRRHSAAK